MMARQLLPILISLVVYAGGTTVLAQQFDTCSHRPCAPGCGNENQPWCNGGATSPDYVPAFSNIIVQNNCRHPVRLAVNYVNEYDQHLSVGWWNIAGTPPLDSENINPLLGALVQAMRTRSITLSDDEGNFLVHSNEFSINFFAITSNGTNIVWRGSFEREVGGETIMMMNNDGERNASGDNIVRLNCFDQ